MGDATLLARDGLLVTRRPDGTSERTAVDLDPTGKPAVDANGRRRVWVAGGQLWRDGAYGVPELVGDVVPGRTRVWLGPAFGFGIHRVGAITTGFVFGADRGRLNDGVALAPIVGRLRDAACAFSTERCWFCTAVEEQGRVVHRCAVVRADGTVEATAEAERDDGSWLGTLHGKAATGTSLFAATAAGVVRVEVIGGAIATTRTFPDTAPFVDEATRLFVAPDGLLAVGAREMVHLALR
jgi:hypothetical protein